VRIAPEPDPVIVRAVSTDRRHFPVLIFDE
jgi:hypothetical protein